jgi:hypothetical protein
MKLSVSQINTLRALRECAQNFPWMGSETLTDQGGHVASLPKLLELGLIDERDHPTRAYRRQWRIRPDAVPIP